MRPLFHWGLTRCGHGVPKPIQAIEQEQPGRAHESTAGEYPMHTFSKQRFLYLRLGLGAFVKSRQRRVL